MRTLAIDVGGTGIKSVVLDGNGKAVSEFLRLETPHPATPKAILSTIADLAKRSAKFDRVALGFPGVVRNGEIVTAPHLHDKWIRVHLDKQLRKLLRKPARVANDAAVQGFAAISGEGIEMVITLGTSMGSALYVDGHVIPNEMGHHPFRNSKTYEDEVGNAVLENIGKKRWNKKLSAVIEMLEKTFNYDRLYIGGGNAKKITLKLPPNVRLIDNKDGLYGAIELWKK
ncbi:MAG: transcriptional regulator/sugar kinase [Acidobacteriales bacterium]|nr:transcriptional regulator/sugar kinase [Terriglobales bacterium]